VGSGRQLATFRTHSRACALSTMPGNRLAQLDRRSVHGGAESGADAGVSYDGIDESQLKNISNLIGYDAVRRLPEAVQRNLRPFSGKLP
jgi:hypothetical protein